LHGFLFELEASVELAVEQDGEVDLEGLPGAVFGDRVEV
jgi:hypothetical protein